jgi:aldose 1-epimerase
MKLAWPLAALLLIATSTRAAAAARYSARRVGDVVRLEDAAAGTIVSIVPSVGNIAFEMKVNGRNVLRWPYESVDAFKAQPRLSGIPFLGPWANRLDEQAFYANGKRYAFDMDLGNVRGAIPIHGFLTTTDQWQVMEVRADRESAWVSSRLDFYRQPQWMKQFPFAQSIQITHRLEKGVLQVTTRVENMGAEPLPLAIGFHPYFQLHDSTRDEWRLSLGARTEWVLASNKIPTGETRPIERLFPDRDDIRLNDYDLDHVFSDLVRDSSGRATMTVRGRQQRLDVLFGPNYRAVVVYAPKAPAAGDNTFVCFEPMTGITDALNLAQKGLYRDLQSIPPGQTWQESFWIRPSGF